MIGLIRIGCLFQTILWYMVCRSNNTFILTMLLFYSSYIIRIIFVFLIFISCETQKKISIFPIEIEFNLQFCNWNLTNTFPQSSCFISILNERRFLLIQEKKVVHFPRPNLLDAKKDLKYSAFYSFPWISYRGWKSNECVNSNNHCLTWPTTWN